MSREGSRGRSLVVPPEDVDPDPLEAMDYFEGFVEMIVVIVGGVVEGD